ncbi:MAG: nucleotidyltransferase domain-containing protein [Candidatus Omnitrophica bacterium]|nr:nucleotidyltransferase domain-containing protein [Candidatus Omnitrophota bacterium]
MGKDEIKKKILKNIEIAKKYKIKSLALFGSFVREDANEESDIDLLVEFTEPTFRNYIGSLRAYEALFEHKVDLVCKDSLKEKMKASIFEEAEDLI